MKLLTLTIFTLLSLIIEISANNESIGSEVLYFYYVYKMQWSSGTVTIATECRPKGGTHDMCYFDDFVKHIMEESFVQQYRPKPADHTKAPTQSNLATFKQAITQQSVSYRMERLNPHLQTATGGNTAAAAQSQAALLESMLGSANQAIDSGEALIADAEQAQEALENAMHQRSPQALDAVDDWLSRKLTEDEQGHVKKTGAVIDWKETLENVDEADDLTDQQKDALKTKMRDISGLFGKETESGTVSDRTHLSILRALQDSTTQIKAGADRGDADIDDKIPAPRESSSECSSDYSSSSSSDSEFKKRGQDNFVAKLLKFAKRQPRAVAKVLGIRQLQSLSLSRIGVTIVSSTSSSIHASFMVSSTPSSSSPPPSTSSGKGSLTTNTGYDMAVTTVFSAPPECTGDITTLATDTGNLWLNVIDPVPKVTMTQCYPSQFVASALATTTLPPFSKLVCPYQWESYNANSTYAVCCPKGFTLHAPHWTETARPGLNAYCSSIVWPSVLMDVTSYDASTFVTVLPETAGTDGNVIYATAFDGNTYIPLTAASTSQSIVSSKSSTLPFFSPASTTTFTKVTTAMPDLSSKPSSTLSVVIKTSSTATITATTKTLSTVKTSSTAKASTALPAISTLPSCGQTCMNNMLGQYATLGCASSDPACVCRNVNFGYGVRDCSNGACGTSVGSSIIAWASNYCSIAEAAKTTFPVTKATATATGIGSLPSCGQTCMNNMIGQYSALGCVSPQAACLCKNVNFGYGIRDCANGACGIVVGSSVIAFGSAYCAQATAAP